MSSPSRPKRCKPSSQLPCDADLAAELARKILLMQLRAMKLNAARATRFGSVRAIHDLRVSIRRFRTALRVLSDVLPVTRAKRLRRRLQLLNRRLGPVRDAQVWLGLLKRSVRGRKVPLSSDWDLCIRRAEASCESRVRALARILAQAPFREAQEFCAGHWPGEPCGQGAGRFLARKLCRATVHIVHEGELPALKTDEEVHALRRRCRRARYLAEFSGPLLGWQVRKLAHRLKRVADALGDWHDAIIQGGLIATMKKPPDELRTLVARRHQGARQDFRKAWRRLTAPRIEKHLRFK